MNKRKDADTRFKELIDAFNTIDQVTKEFDREREGLRRKLRNVIRKRGRGTYNGFESSVHGYDVERLVLSTEKVRERLTAAEFNKCFRKSKYIQLDGGALLSDDKVVPDMGPPVEVTPEDKT